MNITNVDNTTTKWQYCPEKHEEYYVSISAVNNVGEGIITTLTLPISDYYGK